uniref:Uncharacterized mitochondrial protein AtMg00810-like n=1 Tax=Tanacetum cinerariifolium TaxID=118510 RepID=A0A6L2MN37_TANCI|nr:uncharacterized mitochondrial protein AtMg00810-like [Tanacetum cinerariifolium]
MIGDPSRPVSSRKQLETNAMWCYFDSFIVIVEPKNFQQAILESSWIDDMQEEIHEFERLQVWELVPCPDKVMLIKLKWIYKVKTDEVGGELKNKARLDNPSHVYKPRKALYGLKQALRAWYAMLSSFLISQHFSKDTPMVEKNKLDKDLQGTPVDATLYCGMIRSLLYLTSNRPDLIYDTGMSLTAYSDADYAMCQDTRRNTSGSAQFLSDKLVSWSSKKQKSTAISSTKAESISLSSWVKFLRSKDEAPNAIIKCIKNIQVHLNAIVRNVITDNGTEFVNQTLPEFYDNFGITHQTAVARTPQ